MQNKTKAADVKRVTRPYLKGSIIEKEALKSSILVFLYLLGMTIAFLFLASMMVWDNVYFRIVTNGVLLLGAWTLFFSAGVSKGVAHVTSGEILYQKKETGREVKPWEEERSFHPLKGFVIALIGSIPLLICTLLLAVSTKPIMTSFGSLPSWVSSLNSRTEVGDALAYYSSNVGLGMTDILRIIVRMSVMPMVNIMDSSNTTMMFILERVAPVIVLLPGVAYGIGYLCGPHYRSNILTDIEIGKKKARKKARRQQKQKQKQRMNRPGTNQLN